MATIVLGRLANTPACAVGPRLPAPFGNRLADGFEAVLFVLFSCRLQIGILGIGASSMSDDDALGSFCSRV